MTDTPDTHDAPASAPGDGPDLSAEAAAVQAMNPDSLMQRMGIEMVEASAQRLVATMPVAGNTQPYGLLHGGASVVLAETLGSFGAALHAGPGKAVVGLDINATHHRAARSGHRHRHRHADHPGPHVGLLRGRRHRRRREADLHQPDHLPDPGCRAGRLTLLSAADGPERGPQRSSGVRPPGARMP